MIQMVAYPDKLFSNFACFCVDLDKEYCYKYVNLHKAGADSSCGDKKFANSCSAIILGAP